MPTKDNGEWIPGSIPPPQNYPNPTDSNVNCHPFNWAYGAGNPVYGPKPDPDLSNPDK